MAAHTTTLAHQLAEAGHDVTLVSWSPPLPEPALPGGAGRAGRDARRGAVPAHRQGAQLGQARHLGPHRPPAAGLRRRDRRARHPGRRPRAPRPAPRRGLWPARRQHRPPGRRGGPQRAAARAAPRGRRPHAHLLRAGRRGAGPLGRAGPDRPRPRGAARLGRRPSPAPARRRPGRAARPRRPDQAAGPGHRARVQGGGPAHAGPGPGARPHPDRGRRDVGGGGCRGQGARPGPAAARPGPGPRRLRPRRPARPDDGQPRRSGADLPLRHRLPERAPRPAARPARARLRGGHLRRPGPRRGGRSARAPR